MNGGYVLHSVVHVLSDVDAFPVIVAGKLVEEFDGERLAQE